MTEPTGCVRCCARARPNCDRCDVLVGLSGLHVIKVASDGSGLVVRSSRRRRRSAARCVVWSRPVMAGGRCRWLTRRRSRAVRIVWRKRSWRCREPACPGRSFTEQDERIAQPWGLLTTRACWWTIGLWTEHASLHGLPRQLGTTWRKGVAQYQASARCVADDPARFDGVTSLGLVSTSGITSTSVIVGHAR
jgi:transposase